MRLHIHLAETPLEAGTYPPVLTTYSASDWRDHDWESYRQLKDVGKGASAIQFVDQLGSLGPDVHIAHGVWANGEDRRILRQRGVGVALCPRSNRITNTGKDAPVREYLEEGNLVSVGTDSLSSTPTLDLLDDVSMLYGLAREQGYASDDLTHRLIRMMTLGGAAPWACTWAATALDKSTRAHWLISRSSTSPSTHHLRPASKKRWKHW